MIMIVKTPGSQMGSPTAAEEGREEVGGGRWESGERSEVQLGRELESVDNSCDRLKKNLRNSLKGAAGGRTERQGQGRIVETAAARASRRV